ncbi:hypothetical protein [Methylobacterium aquaticum]|uniref:hypothetical protein n=1 Tax=Methylobacterium aquaticum TaxID=270351 RepID=UPI001933D474|nr:hypothetical protein [Methylobacterium aquaticum]QRE74398.1 hypothetical protein F1D61_12990 [Methylobacterium aquaticum]
MESWGKAAEAALRILEGIGPRGALIVAVVVGLGLAVVLIGHFGGLYTTRRADKQSLDFVDRLIAEVDKLAARELALRADLERQERDADSHRLRAVELQADVELMRMQLRRTIEILRAVRDGRLLPSAITDADIAEAVQ